MKIQSECVPCLIKRIIFETKLSTEDKSLQTKAIRNACKTLSQIYDPDKSSAEIATEIHKVVYDTLGDEDPYVDLKNMSNKIAKSLLPKTEEIIKKSNDPLKASILCSIIGNILDFGIEGSSSSPEMLIKVYEQLYDEGLGYDDYPRLKEFLNKAKCVVYFTDNCGEIVFDKIVCREIKKFNPDLFISLIVRGRPIISDATIKDAHEINFSEVVDEIFTTGCFAIGVDFKKLPSEVEQVLKQTDLIICKGMANYEAFSETDYKPIAYLLRTKCSAIANSMDIPLNKSVIKFYE